MLMFMVSRRLYCIVGIVPIVLVAWDEEAARCLCSIDKPRRSESEF
jgi:hypothetical protein